MRRTTTAGASRLVAPDRAPPLTCRRCEYIFYRGLYRTAYARVSRGAVTDTELQVGQFAVPRTNVSAEADTHAARYLRTWKEEMHEDHVRVFALARLGETGC
jgi:hypothetical protein